MIFTNTLPGKNTTRYFILQIKKAIGKKLLPHQGSNLWDKIDSSIKNSAGFYSKSNTKKSCQQLGLLLNQPKLSNLQL